MTTQPAPDFDTILAAHDAAVRGLLAELRAARLEAAGLRADNKQLARDLAATRDDLTLANERAAVLAERLALEVDSE